jgi:hypothetical protein
VEVAVRRLATGLGCELLDTFIEADVVLESPTLFEESTPDITPSTAAPK